MQRRRHSLLKCRDFFPFTKVLSSATTGKNNAGLYCCPIQNENPILRFLQFFTVCCTQSIGLVPVRPGTKSPVGPGGCNPSPPACACICQKYESAQAACQSKSECRVVLRVSCFTEISDELSLLSETFSSTFSKSQSLSMV